jgi:putative oxidoreductase
MDRLTRLRDWLDAHRDLALDLLRIYLGFALFAKGISFIQENSSLMENVSAVPFSYARGLIARYVIISHLGGGLLLAVGLVTRLAAGVQVPALFGAVFFVHRSEGFFTPSMTLELEVLVLFLLILYTFVGAGRLSLDYYVFRRDSEASARAARAPSPPA